MGGDHGPHVTVAAALDFQARVADADIVLVGVREAIEKELAARGAVAGARLRVQPGKSPDRHRALLNCAGRCELESVYDRMMRRLVRHKREMIPSAKITVKTK